MPSIHQQSKSEIQPILNLLMRLWQHVNKIRRLQFLGLFCLMCASALAEIISIGSILPVLGALTNPHQIMSRPEIQYMASVLNIESAGELLPLFLVIFAVAALLAGGVKLSLLYFQTRLCHAVGADFSNAMYRQSLYQPYAVHVMRNSSDVISGISNRAKVIVGSTLIPVMVILSSSILMASIFSAFISIEPIIALVSIAGFFAIYLIVIFATKKSLQVSGQIISKGQADVIRVLQEGLGGIRDILLDGNQELQCEAYRKIDYPLRRAVASIQFISASPRYLIEAIGIVFMSILAFTLAYQEGGLESYIPALGLFAMGAQKTLPIFQQCFTSWASLRAGQASLCDALDLMDYPINASNNSCEIDFKKRIILKDVSFKYAGSQEFALNKINLTILKGSTIGIIGESGSGKSTLLDILMGLLTPVSGEIFVDEVAITQENIAGWQKHIAHVPQSIFILDASIQDNICLGASGGIINIEKMFSASKKAQLTKVINSFADGFHAKVGERGVRFSGGQKQRLGIARALYKDANFMVFDEATSALDVKTEELVMTQLTSLEEGKTIILVSHRMDSLKHCDQIIQMENGSIKKIFTYAELIG